MAQQANIVIADTASTHTLVPDGIESNASGSVAHYREQLTTVPHEAQVHAKLSRQTLPSGVVKATLEVAFPVLESVSGQNSAGYTAVPKIAYVDRIVTTAYISPRSTISGMRHVRRAMGNLLLGDVATPGLALTNDTAPADLVDKRIIPS